MYTKVTGSNKKMTSTAGQDIGYFKPDNETYPVTFKKFEFMNDSDCTISVNKGEEIFLPANFGIELDMKVTSFVIKERGINFSWVGVY